MALLAFLDTETSGLDPDLHEVWDVGLILRDEDSRRELQWQLPIDLGRADNRALDIGRFPERRWKESTATDRTTPLGRESTYETEPLRVHPERMGDFAQAFMRLTWGAHLVGAVVSFDEERLRRLLRRHGACPGWHYHLVDVEALIAGTCGAQPPWDSGEMSRLVGVDPEQFDRHTALGDARWAEALYDAVLVSSGS